MEIVLGLGGNIGDRFENLVRALGELMGGGSRGADGGDEAVFLSPSLGGRPVTVSPIYESDALLPDGAPDSWNQEFYNLAVRGSTRLTLSELLGAVKRIEEQLGRGAHEVWSPRTIDIDILAAKSEGFSWGRGVNSTIEFRDGRLTVPHQALTERPFALWPLADVAPHWVLGQAVGGSSAMQLARGLGRRFTAVRASAGGAVSSVPCATARAPLSIQQRLKEHLTELGARYEDGSLLGTTVVGILNLTPDSFSDGVKDTLSLETYVGRAVEMVNQGAGVIDLGGESTRPGATEVDPAEEWSRIGPVIAGLRNALSGQSLTTGSKTSYVPKISVDTRHHQVAARALEAGADWINDVSGLSCREMQRAVRDSSCSSGAGNGAQRFIFMHSLGVPPIPTEVLAPTEQMAETLITWAKQRLRALQESGLSLERAIFDPGIGFGKTPEQSWQIIQQLERLTDLPVPTLLGHSRKSFLSKASGSPPAERDTETALLSAKAAEAGVAYLRVHNVKATVQAIRAWAYLNC